jgi:general stress protein 26
VTSPTAQLDPTFSTPGAPPTGWEAVTTALEAAEVYWLTTVRPDGRPHTTPLIALWHDDAVWFCTGPGERKAHNLAANAHVTVTTGCNTIGQGLDVIVEGDAERVTDHAALERVAELYVAKYTEDWRFQVVDGAFEAPDNPGPAHVFRVAPTKAFAFAKGSPFSQTRYRFA